MSVRAEARAVGLRVLRRAAAERAREEGAAKERRLVSTNLHHLGEASRAPTAAATPKGCCSACLAPRHTLSDTWPGAMQMMLKAVQQCDLMTLVEAAMCAAGSVNAEPLSLDPRTNPAAAEILAQPVQDTEKSLLGSINMTLLLRLACQSALFMRSQWSLPRNLRGIMI